jgi:hypothetical protein
MSTAFSKIVSAVMEVLAVEPAVCDSNAIYRARAAAIPDQDKEAVSVQWERGLPKPGTIFRAPIDWDIQITVDCFARSTQETGDVAVDALLKKVYARLAEDPTLGGLLDDLVIAGVEAENTNEGKKTGWVRLTYIAQHRTQNLNLE